MIRKPRWAGTVMALWAAMQLSACDSSPTAMPLEDDSTHVEMPMDTALAIDSVGALEPGQPVSLYGDNLEKLTHLTVDGVPVTFSRKSSTEGSFVMPETGACDVDGRPVSIVANSNLTLEGPLQVEGAVELEVGESRILSKQDLVCLQLPGAAEDYLFSVGSLSGAKVFDAVMTLRGKRGPGGGGGSGVYEAPATPTSFALGDQSLDPGEMKAPFDPNAPGRTLDPPYPFDDYANAKVGDVLTFANFKDHLGIALAKSREEVPTYQLVVLAANDKQLIVGDPASSVAHRFDDPDVLAMLQEAADLAAPYAEAAIRAVINPNEEFPTIGAGGRMVSILEEFPGEGWELGTISAEDLGSYYGSSGMYRIRLAANRLIDHRFDASFIASLIIHEAAHLADCQNPLDPADQQGSHGWYAEALAESVVDVAARMAVGVEQDAPDASPLWTRIGVSPLRDSAVDAPWGGPGTTSWGIKTRQAYSRGAQILRYAQQKAGNTGFVPSGPTLHQILVSRAGTDDPNVRTLDEILSDWNLDAIAEAVGMTAEQLLEESMMADLTDGRVPAEAAARWGLPQVEGWANTDPEYRNMDREHVVLPWDTSLNANIALPAAGYAYFYVLGDGEQGFTLEADNVTLKDYHQVRLTRLR